MTLSKKEQRRYEAMASIEERADGVSETGESAHGADAAALGEQLLLEALGSPEAVERRVGRPRVDSEGEKGTASPMIQVRISAARKRDLERLRVETRSKSTSDVIRAAIDEYVERHRLSA
ncbi:hypothetical protein [Leifsonia sp. NPDC080035]|uniref:Ribbon-helix-helix protein CopG domain-containing protein n=1 Tax=Leifsonia sp. NPDC080035 TaxID=3143936 RepID=A0AAU7GF44_9MICO